MLVCFTFSLLIRACFVTPRKTYSTHKLNWLLSGYIGELKSVSDFPTIHTATPSLTPFCYGSLIKFIRHLRKISENFPTLELVYASKVELFSARWKAILIYDFMSTRWRFAIAFVENEKVFCRAEKTKQLIGYPQCLLFIQLTWWMQNKSISRMKGLNYDDPHLNSLSDASVSSLKFFPSQFLRIKSSHLLGSSLFAPSTRDLRIYIFLCVTNSQFGWRMTRAWQTILFTREKPERKKESRRIDDFSLLRLPLFSAALQGVWEKVIKLKFLTLQARAWLEW